MTIRSKTWLLSGLVIVVLASALILTVRLIILHGFMDLEQQFALRNLKRAKNVLSSALEKLNAITGDYSSWDDTYEFVGDTGESSYKEDNFLASSFMNINVNTMLFFNGKNELVSQAFFRNADAELEPAPPALVKAVLSVSRLLGQSDTSNGRFGLVQVDTAVVMAAARPILKNDNVGPCRGTLVMCRFIDSSEIRRLSDIMGQTLSLSAVSNLKNEDDTCNLGEFARSNKPFSINAVGRDRLHGHSILADISGSNAFILTCVSDRPIYHHGLKTYYYALIWLFIIAVSFALVIFFTIERSVLSRIGWLKRAIDEVKRKPEISSRIPLQGKDEVTSLAQETNNMLSAIEQARARAERSELQYGLLFAQMLNGFALHEIVRDEAGTIADYRFLDVNPAFERLTGLVKDQVIGKTAREILPGIEPQWIEHYARVVASGEPEHFEDFSNPLCKHFEVMAFKTGENRFGVTFTDITTRKKAEEERVKAQEQLAQAQKMQAVCQLAGGIAHDFNNQMTGILGYAEMLRDQLAADPKLSRFAANIIKGIRRAADLTAQLLAFARKGKYMNVPVNIHSIILEVVMLLEHTVDKRINISQRFSARPSFTTGDPTQLQNVILNLGINARDAMPEGGNLIFTTETASLDETFCKNHAHELSPGRYLQVSITDTGTGMSPEVRKRLFEPFFTTKPVGKGTGMGLAAAYGTIKHHKGAITVYTEEGKGTTFNLFLPLREETVDAATAAAQVRKIPGNPRILLVDDEEIVADMAQDLLTEIGCRVTRCSNGREAVERYRVLYPEIDLVILDMVMPEMNGKETLTHLQRINPKVKILLASGYSLDDDAQSILQQGALGFLQKPFHQASLSAAIEKALKA